MADKDINVSYQEAAFQLLEAVDIVTSKRVNALGFDKTLICTIESIENAKNGAYRVTDGVSHFQAYADTTIPYTVGLKVYVKVPNGDMNSQKIITGKYVSEDNQYVPYVSPLNSFVDVTSNLIEDNLQSTLRANAQKDYNIIWSYMPDLIYSEEKRRAVKVSIDKDTTELKEIRLNNYNSYQNPRTLLEEIMNNEDLDEEKETILCQDVYDMTVSTGFKGYDRLGISGDFKTLLDYRTKDGSYGLCLRIIGVNQMGVKEARNYYLDSSDMYGNPYQYSTFYKQEYLYDISNMQEILNLELLFYQNKDFILEDGSSMEVSGRDDIILQNPYIAFGYDLNNFNEDKVLIGTHDSLMYSNNIIPKERKVYMRWVHKINDKFYAIDEASEVPENAVIHWYRYRLEENRSDSLAGPFWQEFNPGEDKFNYRFEPDTTTDTDAFKVIIEIPDRNIVTNDIGVNINLREARIKLQDLTGVIQGLTDGIDKMIDTIDLSLLEEIYDLLKAQYITTDEQAQLFSEIHNIILDERARTQFYSSDTLVFTNAIPQNLEAIDLIQSLSITADEGVYDGIYRLYDETYHIINSTEASKQRILKANYSSVVTGITELDSAEEITWYFPKEQSMIQEPVEGKEYNTEKGDEFIEDCGRSGYVAIRRTGTDTVEQLEPGLSLIETMQTFRIKEHYTQSASTNIIYCTVKKRDKIYEASVVLYFGTAGSNGTEATFLLKMYDENGVDEVSALTIGKKVIIKPELYDFNNKRISINSISYSWKEKNKSNAIQSITDGIEYSLTIPEETDINNCQFYILQASTPYTDVTEIDENGEEKKREIQLTAFLPIPVRTNDEYAEIEGATKIVYDSNGANPRYYKNPYKLYGHNLKQYSDITWKVYSDDFKDVVYDEKGNIVISAAQRYYPVVQPTGEFMPTKMYYTGLKSVCINAYSNKTLIWTQPLLIIQNKYASAMLNDWDGNLTIDEKNGTILSAMMGAGIKNEDNSFSGIVMGDMGKVSDNFDPNNKTGIGLYGLDHGAQSYGFNVDGTAFIGKSGKGRIHFDGNNGTITSGNYEEDVAGMQIDLDNSFLKAYGDAGAFEMDMSSNKEELLKISGISFTEKEDGKTEAEFIPLINVGSEYYLQSLNYSRNDYTGLKFHLSDGFLEGYNFKLFTANPIYVEETNENKLSSITLSSNGDPYFKIHHVITQQYEEIPVYKIFEPNTYYWKDENDNFISEGDKWVEGRQYFVLLSTESGNIYEPVLIVPEENIFVPGKFLTYNAEDKEEEKKFYLAASFSPYFIYYTKDALNVYEEVPADNPVLSDNEYVNYAPGVYYYVPDRTVLQEDDSENYVAGREYYTLTDPAVNITDKVLDNTKYMSFEKAYSLGNLYKNLANGYVLDSSNIFRTYEQYYSKVNKKYTLQLVCPPGSIIFDPKILYEKQYNEETEEHEYVLATTYRGDVEYYQYNPTTLKYEEVTDKVYSTDYQVYKNKTFYTRVEKAWLKVEENEAFDSTAIYAFLVEETSGEYYYDKTYVILENDEYIYEPFKFRVYVKLYSYQLDYSADYTEGRKYYELILGVHTPTLKTVVPKDRNVFKKDTYYTQFANGFGYADIYNDFETYYDANFRVLNVYNPEYEFKENTFYTYIDGEYTEEYANVFRNIPYYKKINEVQENDIINITHNKYELKSHNWDPNSQKGMHFDISAGRGYIEGYGEYKTTSGRKRPKFILDWRKNRDPIDVNAGIFKVKWSGEVICSNILALGGKIGGWNISNSGLSKNNIALYAFGNESGIYAGKGANKIELLTSEKVDSNYLQTGDKSDNDVSTATAIGWNSIIGNSDKYFKVDNEGNLYAYIAEIYNLKAQNLYTNNLYINQQQATWKSKNIITSVGGISASLSYSEQSHMHGFKVYIEGQGYYNSTTNAKTLKLASGVKISKSSDKTMQIVYLGGKETQ